MGSSSLPPLENSKPSETNQTQNINTFGAEVDNSKKDNSVFENKPQESESSLGKIRQGFSMKFVALFIIFFLFVLIAIAGYFYLTDDGGRVNSVRISNITANSATISWRTDDSVVGKVYYKKGDGQWLPLIGRFMADDKNYDDRDLTENEDGEFVVDEKTERVTHHVTLRGLDPETVYSFRIVGKYRLIPANVNSFSTKKVNEELRTPEPVYGKIVNQSDETDTPRDGIVYYRVIDSESSNSSWYSSTIDANSGWTGDIGYITDDNGNPFLWDEKMSMDIEVVTEKGLGYEKPSIENHQPLKPLNVLPEDYWTDDGNTASSEGNELSDNLVLSTFANAVINRNANAECTQEKEVACFCPGGETGTQKCTVNGYWGSSSNTNKPNVCLPTNKAYCEQCSCVSSGDSSAPKYSPGDCESWSYYCDNTGKTIRPNCLDFAEATTQGKEDWIYEQAETCKNQQTLQEDDRVSNYPVNQSSLLRQSAEDPNILFNEWAELFNSRDDQGDVLGADTYTGSQGNNENPDGVADTSDTANTDSSDDDQSSSDLPKHKCWKICKYIETICPDSTLDGIKVNGSVVGCTYTLGDNQYTFGANFKKGCYITKVVNPADARKFLNICIDSQGYGKLGDLPDSDVIPGNDLPYIRKRISIGTLKKFLGRAEVIGNDMVLGEDTMVLTTGEYVITGDGIEATTITVTEEEVEVVFFEDLNGDGIQQEDEEDVSSSLLSIELNDVAETVNYDLDAGWNLLGFNFSNELNSNASALIDELNTQGLESTHLASYVDGKWMMYSSRETEGGGVEYYGEDFDVIPGRGYFVKTLNPGAATFSVNTFADPVPIDFDNGWNLISVQGPELNYTAESFINKCEEESIMADTVSRFDSGLYESLVKDDEIFFGNDFNLINKRGYFVRVESGGGSRLTP